MIDPPLTGVPAVVLVAEPLEGAELAGVLWFARCPEAELHAVATKRATAMEAAVLAHRFNIMAFPRT